MFAVSIESIHSQNLDASRQLRDLVARHIGGAVTLLVSTRDPLHKRIDRCADANAWLRSRADARDELALCEESTASSRDAWSRLDADRALRLARHQLEDVCAQGIEGCASSATTRYDELASILSESGFSWSAAPEHVDCLHSQRRIPTPCIGSHSGSALWRSLPADAREGSSLWQLRLRPGVLSEMSPDELGAELHRINTRLGQSLTVSQLLASPLALLGSHSHVGTSTRS
jgi:hypothetical protein